ncbi:hypothetical protein [Methylomonas rapida]|uniref:Uncharacterized protein n=1 Tax=Methylomonas rapida TaxID=2963939 RepID=A0ABY7GF09_9GAMM|nr:hypothetical protein [Methylomonas rapida]WAR43875.1 hypothetical protein NM686_016060 [Methylomonas rapida]
MTANILKHRIDETEIDQLPMVDDAIMSSLNRAQGILILLSFNFDEGVRNQAADHVVAKALDSVLAELTDVREIFRAYSRTASLRTGGAE